MTAAVRLLRAGSRDDAVGRIPAAERELLRLVRRRPGIRVGEAASELRLAPNTISTLVGRAVTDQWLRREPAPGDGRGAVLRLTEGAEREMRNRDDQRVRALALALGRLDAADVRALEACLLPLLKLVGELGADR